MWRDADQHARRHDVEVQPHRRKSAPSALDHRRVYFWIADHIDKQRVMATDFYSRVFILSGKVATKNESITREGNALWHQNGVGQVYSFRHSIELPGLPHLRHQT